MRTKACLEGQGVLLSGSHFAYTPKGEKKDEWFHGPDYIQKRLLSLHPTQLYLIAEDAAAVLVEWLTASGQSIDVIVSPAMGAINFGSYVALHLSWMLRKEVEFIVAEKAGDDFALVDFEDYIQGKNVFVDEDIVNSGGSGKRVVDKLRRLGANVLGLQCIWNRDARTEKDVGDVPVLLSLVEYQLPMYPVAKCPHCPGGPQERPLDRRAGKWKEFLEYQANAQQGAP